MRSRIPPPPNLPPPLEIAAGGETFVLRLVPPGRAWIGWDGNPDATNWEKEKASPWHEVEISAPYYLGETPVTQAQWLALMGNEPSAFKGLHRPVERVSWDDVQLFLEKIRAETNHPLRLPSEVEWEYAARSGPAVDGWAYAGGEHLPRQGWYGENSHNETKPVGLKAPNRLGLYDLSGNVWEWCADHWHDNYEGAPSDGQVWEGGGHRVSRGGSWNSAPRNCRVAYRGNWWPGHRRVTLGFRLALSPQFKGMATITKN